MVPRPATGIGIGVGSTGTHSASPIWLGASTHCSNSEKTPQRCIEQRGPGIGIGIGIGIAVGFSPRTKARRAPTKFEPQTVFERIGIPDSFADTGLRWGDHQLLR